MGIRHWLRKRTDEDDAAEADSPPGQSLLRSLFGRETETPRALGEYDSKTYPQELQDQLRRRAEVAEQLVRMDLTDRETRVAAIPELRTLLRRYPHPLAYEALILAYVDSGRYDEARGVAFAARERRIECARSKHPEICAETARLSEWTPEDVDELRREREGRAGAEPAAGAAPAAG
jgi:hypothetical protein